MTIPTLLKNKYALIAISISLIVLIVSIILTSKKDTPLPPSPTSSVLSSSSFELVDLSQERRNETMRYVEAIENKLPLAMDDFKTSVGITTSINIFRGEKDLAEIVRLEITGLSYINKNELDKTKNPNVVAFEESFRKAIEMLESQNIDPKQLIFVYGTKDYVRNTARYWVDQLKLL